MARRRAQGEGTVRKMADGRYQAITPHEARGGKRKKKIFTRERDAIAWLREQRRLTEQGVDIYADQQTVAAFLDQWLAQHVKRKCRARTYRSYADTCRLHIAPHIGDVPLQRLAPPRIEQMLAALGNTRTAQYARAILSRALNKAIKWNLLQRNPVNSTEVPVVESEPAPILSDAEIERVLEAIKGDRLENLYRLLLGLGLRRGEALGLLWADVDLEAGTIKVTKALQRAEGKLERGETKSPRATRTLFLPDYLVDALRDQWARLKAEREHWGMGWKEHGLVFPSEIGTPLEPSNVSNRYWKRVLERAGLSSAFTLHGLRHACASFMIVEGVDPRTVADILGHAKVSTTLNIYAHSNQEAQRDALGKVERKRKKG